jgi:hypothetical protein
MREKAGAFGMATLIAMFLWFFALTLDAQTRTMHAATVILADATTTATSAVFKPQTHNRSYQVYGATSSGSGSATVVIEVSSIESPVNSTNVDWITMGTVTLTLGTTRTSDGFVSTAAWRNVRARVTAISGTGAAVSVVMGN